MNSHVVPAERRDDVLIFIALATNKKARPFGPGF
jgi:hypothetical protein